jgi:hypothetical protein
VRCGRCGNENAEGHRFCGMCGASLVATAQGAGRAPVAAPTGNVAVPVSVPGQSAPRAADQAPLPEPAGLGSAAADRRPASRPSSHVGSSAGPVITGHSFLGLSTPGPAADSNAERDPLRPSSNLDYLLEDEEEPKRGWGKPIVIVVALALAVGFGYLHWKQGGFDWLNAGDKKPGAKQTADATQSPDSGGATGGTTPGGAAPAAGASNTGTAPATNGAASPVEPAAGQAVPSPATSQAAPIPATPSPAAPSQAGPSQTSPAQNSPTQIQPTDPSLSAASAAPPAGSDADNQPPPEPKAVARKPSPAKTAAAKLSDPVTEAERYIYGRGVRQDCDHGLRLMKPAAEQSNTKAMISLGALYSTGTCTPRDLPTAYRWFALALHKEPDNQALQDDLQKLWSQMTPPERQLAIKLSQ